MIPLLSIYTGGILTLVLSVFHARFYFFFNWKNDFEKVSILNRKILYTIHVALLLIFLMIAVLTLIYAKELSMSRGLAFGFNLLNAGFWVWRLLWQLLYFKNKKEVKIPSVGIILIAWFALLAVSYLVPVIYRVF